MEHIDHWPRAGRWPASWTSWSPQGAAWRNRWRSAEVYSTCSGKEGRPCLSWQGQRGYRSALASAPSSNRPWNDWLQWGLPRRLPNLLPPCTVSPICPPPSRTQRLRPLRGSPWPIQPQSLTWKTFLKLDERSTQTGGPNLRLKNMHTTAWKSCPHLLLHFIEVYSRALSNGTRSSALMPWDRTWNRPTLCDMLGATSVKAVCPCVLLSVAWSRCTLLLTCMVMACLCSLSGFLSFFLSFFLFFFFSFFLFFFLSLCVSFFLWSFLSVFIVLLYFLLFLYLVFFSPTCQVRVSRFYQSCLPPSSSFFLPPPSSSFLLLPPPSSSFQLQISVDTAGPQLRAPPNLSGHCQTPTASSAASLPCKMFWFMLRFGLVFWLWDPASFPPSGYVCICLHPFLGKLPQGLVA